MAGTDVAKQIGSTSPEENECSSSCQHKNRTKQSPGFVLRANAENRDAEGDVCRRFWNILESLQHAIILLYTMNRLIQSSHK